MLDYSPVFQELGIQEQLHQEIVEGVDADYCTGSSPANGAPLPAVRCTSKEGYEVAVQGAKKAFLEWRTIPTGDRDAPLILLEEQLLLKKEPLSWLITLETGKPIVESRSEVEAAAAYCQMAAERAVAPFRTLFSGDGAGELYEEYHPLGVVGVITARNFPVLLWVWNAMMAIACGNSVVWKPSAGGVRTALALQRIAEEVCNSTGAPIGLFRLVVDRNGRLGALMGADKRLPLVCFTGSRGVGIEVARTVTERLGRTNLELGSCNAAVVAPSADPELAIDEIVRAATLTSGQRCTSLRRLIVHESIYETISSGLLARYADLKIGDPFRSETQVGPLMHEDFAAAYAGRLRGIMEQGGTALCGGDFLDIKETGSPLYATPAIVEVAEAWENCGEELFAPLLLVSRYRGDIREAIRFVNDSPYGLAASLFTEDPEEAAFFCSAEGADCGMVYINRGTTGSDLRLAFGGEKDSGGGRVSGSDAWKVYMRRQSGIVQRG